MECRHCGATLDESLYCFLCGRVDLFGGLFGRLPVLERVRLEQERRLDLAVRVDE